MLPQTGCGLYNGPKVYNSRDSCGRDGDEVMFFQDLYLKVQGDVNHGFCNVRPYRVKGKLALSVSA